MKPIKIVVEKHPEGYVAYPLGLNCVVVGGGTFMRMPWLTCGVRDQVPYRDVRRTGSL